MNKNKIPYYPHFLAIPHQVYRCPGLRVTDCLVFGVVYYFIHLKKKKCIASNKEIGRIIKRQPSTIGASLARLEKAGLIKRILYTKDGSCHRSEIIPLVKVGVVAKNTSKWSEEAKNAYEENYLEEGLLMDMWRASPESMTDK